MTEDSRKRKTNVLVIEDNLADVQLLQLAFQNAALDCELTVICDGAEALAYVRQQGADSSAPVPDMAILDLNLPKYDGIEILEAMRANPALAGVPVAVVSSSSWPRERTRLQALGVARYITKPSDLDAYLDIGLTLKELVVEKKP